MGLVSIYQQGSHHHGPEPIATPTARRLAALFDRQEPRWALAAGSQPGETCTKRPSAGLFALD